MIKIPEFFSEGQLEELSSLRGFRMYQIGPETYLHAVVLGEAWSGYIQERILAESPTLGQLDCIISFVRYNSKTRDSRLRIHSDGSILGRKVKLAGVIYLNDGEGVSGTALLSHPRWGSRSKDSVFEKDDSRWSVDEYQTAVKNLGVFYEADRFHARWPAQSETRKVVVTFFG